MVLDGQRTRKSKLNISDYDDDDDDDDDNDDEVTTTVSLLTVDKERHVADDGVNIRRRWRRATVQRQAVVSDLCHTVSYLQAVVPDPRHVSQGRDPCLQAVVSDSCHEASCLPHRRHAHHSQTACRLFSIFVPVLAAVNAAGLPSQLEAAAKVEQPGDVEPVYVDVEHWRRVAADGDTAHINWLPRDHC